MPFKREPVLLSLIMAAGLGLRLIPVAADLPHAFWLDEVNYIDTALRFGTGNFNLFTLSHGALYQLVLFVEYAAFFLMGRAFGWFSNSTDFFLAYLKDPTLFYLLARITSALCGVGVVGFTYGAGARLYDKSVGLGAALLTAFSLLMYQMSFLALADMPAVLLLTVAAWLLAGWIGRPQAMRGFCAAAFLIGLAAAAKYHAGVAAVLLPAAAFLATPLGPDRPKALIRLSLLACAFLAGGFLIGIPQAALHPQDFYKDVFVRMGGEYIGENTNRFSWLFWLTHHLPNGLRIPLAACVLLGVASAVRRRSPSDLFLLSFPAALSLVLMQSVGFAYHLLPALPFLLILAARLIGSAARRLAPGAPLAATLLLAFAAGLPSFLDSLRYARLMLSPDTKVLAKQWIERNVPAGSTVMMEGYIHSVPIQCPPLAEDRKTLERDLASISAQGGTGLAVKLRLNRHGEVHGRDIAFDIIKEYRLEVPAIARLKPPYLIMTDSHDRPTGKELYYYIDRYISKDYFLRRSLMKEEVLRSYELAASFAPGAEFTFMFPHLTDADYRAVRAWPLFSPSPSRGPLITVWERKPARG